jgi:hypothetical protein
MGVHFDWTITLGNLLSIIGLFLTAIGAWTAAILAKRDLEWRITNLEVWRKEHMIDADSRDSLIETQQKTMQAIEKLLEHVKTLVEERGPRRN